MKLLFLGDMFYDYDYTASDIERIGKWIYENDYKTIINLESAIDSDSFNKIKKRGPNLSSNKHIIEVLKKLNVVGVTLSNNHTMDFGEKGILHTIELLESNGIKYCGIGSNLNQASRPFIIDDGSKPISIYSFGWDIEETVYATEKTFGCAPYNVEYIKDILNKSDKVNIVCLHYGFEYNRLPMPIDIQNSHDLIENGCDLIIGNHPHCVQPKEVYREKDIYYALGNFYFSSKRDGFTKIFDEKIKNQSDYSVGVIYDTDTAHCEEVLFVYDRKAQETMMVDEENKDLILEDITNVDYLSKSYYSKVRKRKKNFNPVLTMDRNSNNRKLNLLFTFYELKRIAKLILKKR